MGDLGETICALSTAPGRAGIAVVRLSGSETHRILERVFRPLHADDVWAPRQARLGSIVDVPSGASLDRVLVTCFPAPHSYTGEDVAEISLHGSPVLVGALLENLCRCGARLAEPGEFTMRGFLNGRMDLVQSEAVRDIVEAGTLYQAQVAARQHEGSLSRALSPLKKRLVEIIVQLEAAVEFVEERLATAPRAVLLKEVEDLTEELRDWIDSFRRGRIVREGFSLAIVGRPNVGKSSLFNALLARERSIVTEHPGTTRDLVSEETSIEGIPVRLTDTAGVRQAGNTVERLGVDRSYQAMADADAVLLVADRGRAPDPGDWELRQRLSGLACILVLNKCDLQDAWREEQKAEYAGDWPRLEVSATEGIRIEKLRGDIWIHLFGDTSGQRDGTLVTNLRQAQCLEGAHQAMARVRAGLGRFVSEEYILTDLREALHCLGALTGETGTEEILSRIFSQFCVGK